MIPFLVGGFPTTEAFVGALEALDAQGAPAIEIGFPFSDPIADGPVIAQAMHETIESGFTTQALFDAVAAARPRISAGLVAMVSVSIVARVGYDEFAARARAAGFDALLVPDAPIDESPPIRAAADAQGLQLALLVAPSTPEDRAAEIAGACTAFVYLLARAGITGDDQRATTAPATPLEDRVMALKPHTGAPIACGFGISTADDVAGVNRHADAAIVGTAFTRAMRGADDPAKAADDLFQSLI